MVTRKQVTLHPAKCYNQVLQPELSTGRGRLGRLKFVTLHPKVTLQQHFKNTKCYTTFPHQLNEKPIYCNTSHLETTLSLHARMCARAHWQKLFKTSVKCYNRIFGAIHV